MVCDHFLSAVLADRQAEAHQRAEAERRAAEEQQRIASRRYIGRLQKAKGGGYAGGGAPFGYECLRGGKKLYVNATEAKAVRRVFEIKQSLRNTIKSIKWNCQRLHPIYAGIPIVPTWQSREYQ